MRDIVLELLKLTIMIATMLITRYAIPWIKAKTENETMQVIIDLVAQAVLAAEQCHQAMPGGEILPGLFLYHATKMQPDTRFGP